LGAWLISKGVNLTMRAVRFAAQLEFTLDPTTEAGIPPALPSLAKVSRDLVSFGPCAEFHFAACRIGGTEFPSSPHRRYRQIYFRLAGSMTKR
jgi:hypothetical protein